MRHVCVHNETYVPPCLSHTCRNPTENSPEAVKCFCPTGSPRTPGNLYLNDVEQGNLRTAVAVLGTTVETGDEQGHLVTQHFKLPGREVLSKALRSITLAPGWF